MLSLALIFVCADDILPDRDRVVRQAALVQPWSVRVTLAAVVGPGALDRAFLHVWILHGFHRISHVSTCPAGGRVLHVSRCPAEAGHYTCRGVRLNRAPHSGATCSARLQPGAQFAALR